MKLMHGKKMRFDRFQALITSDLLSMFRLDFDEAGTRLAKRQGCKRNRGNCT